MFDVFEKYAKIEWELLKINGKQKDFVCSTGAFETQAHAIYGKTSKKFQSL